MKKLLFFDIDGTLLRTYGAGRTAVETGLSARFNQPIQSGDLTFGGKTDPQILREVLTLNGIEAHEVNLQAASEAYMEAVQRLLPQSRVEMMPNMRVLLTELANHTKHELSLLTGNYEPMAFLKLAQVQLDHFFSHGAFGSDHEDRNQLPQIGINRVKTQYGLHFEPTDVVVIGDTPRDIECAHFAGAKCVAVATGGFSTTELAHADLVLENFKDIRPFFDFLQAAS